VALLVAAAACAFVASKSSSDELRGAYHDSARAQLRSATAGFDVRLAAADLQVPSRLREELRGLVGRHGLSSAAVYLPGRSTPVASAGPSADSPEARLAQRAMSAATTAVAERDGARQLEALALPLRDGNRVVGAIAATYDLAPANAQLARRNRRVAIVLTLLLGGFALFAAAVLQRGIFRPLHRLRIATRAVGAGNLATRLRWRRRDELGELAADFDTMAGDLEQHNRRLEEQAHRDPLTGLANHRHFQELLGKELEVARQEGHSVALVVLDIDDFKRINDARGHTFGDDVLVAAAEGLRSAMRGLGAVGRVGGDEFGLVLADADSARAFALAEAARTAVEGSPPMRGALRCSAGIACYPEDARNASALLQLADGALFWAKESGRGRTRRYDPEHVFVVTEEQREDFAELIARPDAVRPVFQPIVSLASGEAVGFEALARFDGKPGLPPSWWFSQAHRFGLGAALEAEAIRVALEAPERPEGTYLSVNLSPSALGTDEVRAQLPEDLSGIVIEITEEERVLDIEGLQRHLDPLRARGARMAVDDAGEGYAGLQQVMRMRADLIKLDRALVSQVHTDPAKIALIGSLVHFARSTGASICAEGIETLEELRVLTHLGVSTGQGWALARPGQPWPRVNAEAARLCRELRSEKGKIIPLGARRPASA
jgi:diguanylate cyclase (GGDEF)-like protein